MGIKLESVTKLLIVGAILFWITGCTMGPAKFAKAKSKSQTFQTTENNYGKIFSTALRVAAETGITVESSDKNGGTFLARDHNLKNMRELNFFIESIPNKSGYSITLVAKASKGGEKVIESYINNLKNYIPINSNNSVEKTINNNKSTSSKPSEKTSAILVQGALPQEGDLFVGGKFAIGGVGDFGIAGSAEKVLQEDFLNLGDIPAVLGAGVTVGYTSWGSRYLGYTNTSITDFRILGRAYYHADVLKNEKIDTYVTFGLGLRIWRVNYDIEWLSDITSTTLISESSLGIRYFISNALSVAAELGYGIGAVRVGVDLTL